MSSDDAAKGAASNDPKKQAAAGANGGRGRDQSFIGVQEIIENCTYLNALNDQKSASTEILTHLPPYTDPKVQEVEEKCRQKNDLRFEIMFSEVLGYSLFTRYLRETYGIDKALFLKDVENYQQMRFEPARCRVARHIIERYLSGRSPDAAVANYGVFDAIKMRNIDKLESPASSMRSARKLSDINENKDRAAGAAASDGGFPESAPSAAADDHSVGTDASVPVVPPGNAGGAGGAAGAPADHPPFIARTKRTRSYRQLNRHLRTQTLTSTATLTGQLSDDEKTGANGVVTPRSGRRSRANSISDIDFSTVEFGEPNLLNASGRVLEDIKRMFQGARAPKELFAELARDVRNHLIRDVYPQFQTTEYWKLYIRSKYMEQKPVTLDDFTIMRVLGRGGFGTVFACRKIDSGRLYAMKAINKKLIKYKKAIAMTMLERHTLSLVKSRFVCGLKYAFQDKTHLFLVMDLMAGGDLKFHLTKQRGGTHGFPEERVRFHAAEILLALEAMHTKNIIFRDLKLENVLLDNEGHAKITDLGLVALYGKKAVTHYAGTPGYIAPEVAKKIPYTPAVDIFSFGVTIYRMLCGKKPFKGHTRKDFDRAVCQDEPTFDPSAFSATAVDLLKGLMEKDPERRLGCGEEGLNAIKDHPFFEDIDWGLLEVGYLEPPFVPNKHDVNANSLEDIGFEDADAKAYAKIELDQKFNKQIEGFEFVSREAVQEEIVSALSRQHEDEVAKKKPRKASSTKQPNAAANKCCVIL